MEFQQIPDLRRYFKGNVGMLGVVGTKEITLSNPWWFDINRLYNGKLSGEVTHWGLSDPYEVTDYGDYGDVVVLDGVCLITRREVLYKVGIPKFKWCKWDYYDHIISLEFIKAGYRLKTVPIKLVHLSKGGGGENMEKTQKYFVKKYFKKKEKWSV